MGLSKHVAGCLFEIVFFDVCSWRDKRGSCEQEWQCIAEDPEPGMSEKESETKTLEPEQTPSLFLVGSRGGKALENACCLIKQWGHACSCSLARCPKLAVFQRVQA